MNALYLVGCETLLTSLEESLTLGHNMRLWSGYIFDISYFKTLSLHLNFVILECRNFAAFQVGIFSRVYFTR